MILLNEKANIRAWYRFLVEQCDLQIGKDWCWAWEQNCWAIQFHDEQTEVIVRLRISPGD